MGTTHKLFSFGPWKKCGTFHHNSPSPLIYFTYSFWRVFSWINQIIRRRISTKTCGIWFNHLMMWIYKKYFCKFILKEIYILISLFYLSMMSVTCDSKIKKMKNKRRINFFKIAIEYVCIRRVLTFVMVKIARVQ